MFQGGIYMGFEIVPFLLKKKINRYPDFDYSDLQLVNFRVSNYDTEQVRMNLVLPLINKKSIYGGISTALKFFFALSKKYNADMRIIVTDVDIDSQTQKDYPEWNICDTDIDLQKDNVISLCAIPPFKRNAKTIAIRKNDFFITTSWKTKYVFENISKFQNDSWRVIRPVLYFIQDYEPGFYAWSTDSVLADSTYMDHNIIAVFNSKNLRDYFQKLNYHFEHEYYFNPILNPTMAQVLKESNTNTERAKRILFYGRPFEQRNCFSLGVESLRRYIQKYKPDREWEFISIGAWHRSIDLGCGHTLYSKGKLSLEEYAELLLSSKVGISLMCSPHPSYPPLEMATFGVRTVTNSYICKDLTDFSNNIISVRKMSIENLAYSINKAVQLSACEPEINLNSYYFKGEEQFNEIITQLQSYWGKRD